MTINITEQIERAYERYLNETVDTDFRGQPVLRRSVYPHSFNVYAGLVDFAAGWQAAKEANAN